MYIYIQYVHIHDICNFFSMDKKITLYYCVEQCIALCCAVSGSELKKGMAGNPAVLPHHTSPCSLIHDDTEEDEEEDHGDSSGCMCKFYHREMGRRYLRKG